MGATIAGVNGAAIRNADVRHADRPARPAAHSAGIARRPAEAHDREPHAGPSAEPTPRVRIDVKQKPGLSYPKPVHHVRIVGTDRVETGKFRQPLGNRHERNGEACPSNCPTSDSAPCPPDAAE